MKETLVEGKEVFVTTHAHARDGRYRTLVPASTNRIATFQAGCGAIAGLRSTATRFYLCANRSRQGESDVPFELVNEGGRSVLHSHDCSCRCSRTERREG